MAIRRNFARDLSLMDAFKRNVAMTGIFLNPGWCCVNVVLAGQVTLSSELKRR